MYSVSINETDNGGTYYICKSRDVAIDPISKVGKITKRRSKNQVNQASQ